MTYTLKWIEYSRAFLERERNYVQFLKLNNRIIQKIQFRMTHSLFSLIYFSPLIALPQSLSRYPTHRFYLNSSSFLA